MLKKLENIGKIIGNTPLYRLPEKIFGPAAEVYLKLENRNPGGSVKDRPAFCMIREAFFRGKINGDTVIVEPTSGNTGIGIAWIASALGIKSVLVMPGDMSEERRKLLRAYGAELRLTPAEKGMRGSIELAAALAAENPSWLFLNQFENADMVKAHVETTAPEIDREIGAPDFFVAGVGTGSTVTGVGKYFREAGAHTRIVAVEPAESPVISGGEAGVHGIQGIGAGFIPGILDTGVLDIVERVSFSEASGAVRRLREEAGILCGFSGGAAFRAAVNLSGRGLLENKKCVILIPDTGERYFSTGIFD